MSAVVSWMLDMSPKFQWENAGWQGWQIFGEIIAIMQQAVRDCNALIAHFTPYFHALIRSGSG